MNFHLNCVLKRCMSAVDKNISKEYVVTATFGDRAENHVGMQMLGELSESGMSLDDLNIAKSNFERDGFVCELIDLVKCGKVEDVVPTPEPAKVLIIRGGYKAFIGDEKLDSINREMLKHDWDTKAYMRGRVVNKKARYNLIFSEESQEPDYESKKGRIVAYKDVPLLSTVRDGLPKYFGDKSKNLYVEGNYYYDMKNTYIGFHGDAERRIVVAMRLGTVCMPFHYQWFQRSEAIGNRIIVHLNPGDVYVMSEKAVGTDWLKKTIPTLRHATAMNDKFLKVKEAKRNIEIEFVIEDDDE